MAGPQSNVTAGPDGVIKPLPNGTPVKLPAAGTDGQLQYNNAGVTAGVTLSGDVTLVGSTGIATISPNSVTNDRLAKMPAGSIKGNSTGATDNPTDLNSTQAKALLAITTGDVSGLGSIATQNSNAVNLSGGIISGVAVTGLAAPVAGSDAVNLDYVSSLSAGITPRTGVAVATTANITLSGEQTIDGVITSASRVLVKNQSAPAQNGVYTTAAGAWSRATDSDTAAELKFGYYYFVSGGTTQAATSWFIQTAPVVLNTDPVVFSQFSASQSYLAGTGLNLVGNTFSIKPAQTGLTITASAFNGTIGATTPSTGVFTTAFASGAGSAPYFRVQSSGSAVDGLFGSAFDSSTMGIGTVSAHNLVVYRGNVAVGIFSSAGFNGAIGGTTPAAGAFTTAAAGNAVGLNYGFKALSAVAAPQFFAYDGVISNGYGGGVRGYSVVAQGGYAALGTMQANTWVPVVIVDHLSAVTLAGTLAINTAANLRTTKGNLNLLINVKDFGALGDGVTNDTAAVASAKNFAISTSGTLYFPRGTFMTDLVAITGATGLRIAGDGMGLSIVKSRTGSQVFNISSSTYITICDLTINGNCSARTAGQQALIIDASYSTIDSVEILKSGEYALFAGSGVTTITNLSVSNVYIHDCYADGINFQNVARSVINNPRIDGADDDLIAIGFNASGACTDITINGGVAKARNDLGTTWGRGLAILGGVSNITVSGLNVSGAKQTGLYIAQESGSGRPTNININGCTFKGNAISSGHSIALYKTTDVTLSGIQSINPIQGSLCEIADWINLTIQGGQYTQENNVFGRGIHTDESGGWGTSWNNLRIIGASITMTGGATNSCVYLSPTAGIAMSIGAILGVVGLQAVAGDYITVSSAATGVWKVGNNVTLTSGRTITASTTTTFNNN